MDDIKKEPAKAKDDNITYVERNGKTFMIINHFSSGQTYTDIIKNALRREVESI